MKLNAYERHHHLPPPSPLYRLIVPCLTVTACDFDRVDHHWTTSPLCCSQVHSQRQPSTQMSQQYSSVPEAVSLDDTMGERKRSLSISSIGSGSDISYNDPLDVEPFNEKRSGSDSRFQDEPALEDGDEGSRFLGTRRVRPTIQELRTGGADSLAAASKTVQEDFGCFSWDTALRRCNRGIICFHICWTVLLCDTGE
jgi:hypothetical protein